MAAWNKLSDAPAHHLGAPPRHRMGLYLRRDLSREKAVDAPSADGGARDQCRGVDHRREAPLRFQLIVRSGRHGKRPKPTWRSPRFHRVPVRLAFGCRHDRSRVEPGGECLAIHARQLVDEPDGQWCLRTLFASEPARGGKPGARCCGIRNRRDIGDASHRNARNWPPSRISSTVFWRRTERFTVSSTTRRSVYSSAFATNMASRARPS